MEQEQKSVRQLLGVLRMENTGRSDVGQLQVRSRGCVTVEKRATLPFRHRCSVLSADGHRLWTDLLLRLRHGSYQEHGTRGCFLCCAACVLKRLVCAKPRGLVPPDHRTASTSLTRVCFSFLPAARAVHAAQIRAACAAAAHSRAAAGRRTHRSRRSPLRLRPGCRPAAPRSRRR